MDHFISQPLVTTLAWTLLHFVWQGAVISAVAAVLWRQLRGAAPTVRYAVGVASLGAMVLCTVVTFAILSSRTAAVPSSAASVQRQTLAESQVSDHVTAPSLTLVGEHISAPSMTLVSSSSQTSSAVSRLADQSRAWLALFVAIWAMGVALLSVRLAGGWFVANRLTRRGVSPVADEIAMLADRLMARLSLTRAVRLLESSIVRVPTVIGWITPVVLVPASALTGLSSSQLEALLAHELAHIRRHDYLVNVLQSAVETLLFYHPAVWWISRRVRIEREHCCDDVAIDVCGDRAGYAAALATLEVSKTMPSMAVAATGGSLVDRIRRIVGVPPTPKQTSFGWVGAVFMLLIVAVLSPAAFASRHVADVAAHVPLSVLGLASQGAPTTQLRLADWASKVRCTVTQQGKVLSEHVGVMQPFSCPATDQVVSCEADNVEPLDHKLTDVCHEQFLPLTPGVALQVRESEPADLDVEWVQVLATGTTVTHAKRHFDAGSLITPVASTEERRLLRFSRADASPVTVAAADLVGPTPWKLPSSQSGGELLIAQAKVRVEPAVYRIVGPRSFDVTRRGNAMSTQGLPEGRYMMTSVYDGGIAGQSATFVIEALRTTTVTVPVENVGAADVVIGQGLCGAAATIAITHVTKSDATTRITDAPVSMPVLAVDSCDRHTIGGLAPGNYEAAVSGHDVARVVVPFTVRAQEVTDVPVAPLSVSVSGRVSFNDHPLEGPTIEFTLNGGRDVAPVSGSAIIDAAGYYAVQLKVPGTYTVSLRGKFNLAMPGQVTTAFLQNGANTFDWPVIGGRITVNVQGWDHSSGVNISTKGTRVGQGARYDGDDPYPFVLGPYAFDTYTISARAPASGLIAKESKTVVLSKDHPEATVDLELVTDSSVLTLTDATGSPVSASVTVSGRQVTEITAGSGSYPVNGFTSGAPIWIRAAGFATGCSLASVGTISAVLEPSRSVEIEYSRDTGTAPPGSLIIPGSNCPVSLATYAYAASATDHRRFTIQNFPAVSSVSFLWPQTGERQTLSIPDVGPVQIKIPAIK